MSMGSFHKGVDICRSGIYGATIVAADSGRVMMAGYGNYGTGYGGYIYGALLGFAIIGLIILISKGGMGVGDAEIAGLIGIFLGLKLTITALFLAIIIGGLTGLILVMLKKKSMKEYFAFGPFLSIGAYIAILYGNEIANWYLSKFI